MRIDYQASSDRALCHTGPMGRTLKPQTGVQTETNLLPQHHLGKPQTHRMVLGADVTPQMQAVKRVSGKGALRMDTQGWRD